MVAFGLPLASGRAYALAVNTLQLQFLISILAGWMNRGQRDIIEYLQQENRVLREQLGAERLLFTDVQRRRLDPSVSISSSRSVSAIFGKPCGNTRSTTTRSATTKVGATS